MDVPIRRHLPRLLSRSQKQNASPLPGGRPSRAGVAVTPITSRPSNPLSGAASVPGDKSISHRALMLGLAAVGETRIEGLLEAEDVMATAAAIRALGAEWERSDGTWRVFGRGIGGLLEATGVLDMGNSGTGVRLLMGLVASQPLLTFVCGDASLYRRPMRRVIEPLSLIGANIWARGGDRLPLAIRGAGDALPIEYAMPVASAQVKSAILLAGLNAPGRTTVIEPAPTRDHTERLLTHFGARVHVEPLSGGGRRITLEGQPELSGRPVAVPGDVSSAAFPIVAALLVPGSRVMLRRVGFNPLRTGLVDTLLEMGARITVWRRTDRGSADRSGPARRSGCAGSAGPLDDRRVSHPRRCRRGGARHHPDARTFRTAGEGNGPSCRDRAGTGRLRRQGGERRRLAEGAGRGRPAAGGRAC